MKAGGWKRKISRALCVLLTALLVGVQAEPAVSFAQGDGQTSGTAEQSQAASETNETTPQAKKAVSVEQQVQTAVLEGQSGETAEPEGQNGGSTGTESQSGGTASLEGQNSGSTGTESQSGGTTGSEGQNNGTAGSEGLNDGTTDSESQSGETGNSENQAGGTAGAGNQNSETAGSEGQNSETAGSESQNGETAGSEGQNGEAVGSENQNGETTASEEQTEEAEVEVEEELTEEETAVDWCRYLAASAGTCVSTAGAVDESVKFVPGTYTVTANIYVPGELNTQIPGVTAYMTNPNNPLGIVDDNGSCETALPTVPVSDNATLTIGEDGVTRTLTIPTKNPVFTLQAIGSGSNVKVVNTVKNSNSYGPYTGRITRVTVTLGDNSGHYEFTGCVEYPTLLNTNWYVPLSMDVNLQTVPTQQEETEGKVYTILSGDGSSWQPESGETLLFFCDGAYEKLSGVAVDGTTLTSEYNGFSSYGTYVELTTAYLQTLSAGAHTIELRFADGTASAGFTVETAQTETSGTESETVVHGLKAGTYQVTANVYLPGELNTELPGTTAYLTNPDNPLGIGGHSGIPMTPVKDNATLVVGTKGELTVIVDLVNPVFTLQKISSGANVTVLAAERDSGIYTGVSGLVSRTGRVVRLYVSLKDGTGVYQFGDCTEFPTLLETDWKVPLQLGVAFAGAKWLSGETTITLPQGSGTGETEPVTETEKEETESTEAESETSGKGAESTSLKAGTYTVAANIWIDRSSSGLPLSPHLTSSVFPPKDPVSNNATLTVDGSSNAVVVVPIVIPDKVMSVKSISGLNISSSSSSGGYLTGITVDLGKVTDPNAVITKSCTVSLDLGELAQTISGNGREQVWAATFQVNLSGVPSGGSGGGNVDVNALLAKAEAEKAKKQEQTVLRAGVLPGRYALGLSWMMHDAQMAGTGGTVGESQPAAGTGGTVGESQPAAGMSGTVTSSQTPSETDPANNTQAGSEINWQFTVETLQAAEADLSAEDAQKTLEEQLLKRFAEGSYDVIICSREAAERLISQTADGTCPLVLACTKYLPAEGAGNEVPADDGIRNEAYADNGTVNGLSADEAEISISVALVSRECAEKYPAAVLAYIKEYKESAARAAADPARTAEYAAAVGLYETAEEAANDLKQWKQELYSGTAMEQVLEELPEIAALGETVLFLEAAAARSEQDPDSGTAPITDEESLSNAIAAALAEREADPVTVSNSSGIDQAAAQEAAKALEPGTYTVSANMYLPGELNTQLPGTTAYMTNPDNPLGVGGHEGIPMTPVTDNATLIVGTDDVKTVIIDLANPVFTLQEIGSPANSELLAQVRDEERYEGTNGVGVDGRIIRLYIRLLDDGGLYPYGDCHEFPTLLETDWYVALEMSVEFTTAQKVSEETEVSLPEDGDPTKTGGESE